MGCHQCLGAWECEIEGVQWLVVVGTGHGLSGSVTSADSSFSDVRLELWGLEVSIQHMGPSECTSVHYLDVM